jgi:hypothetical protein
MGNCNAKAAAAAKDPKNVEAAKNATRDLAVAVQGADKPAEAKPAQPPVDEDWEADETCTTTGADGKPQPVIVLAKNANGTYKVKFENGTEKDQVVKSALSPRTFAVGDRVEARWKGGNWFYGSIKTNNNDNTYVVHFDDDTDDERVLAWHIKSEAPGQPRAVGDRVAVRTFTSDTYRVATVVAVNANKTYTIQFDDETEPINNVRQSYIKDLDWETDDSVMVEYYGTPYPAVVVAKNADGVTIKVKFDGGSDVDVPIADIRCHSFVVGQRVEGRWKSGSNWYPGQVTADNGNETYAVHFDDNTDDLKQPAWHMKPESEGQYWSIGDLVEARGNGGAAYFYDGTIVAINRDGSYNVQDASGTVHEDIRQSYIRPRVNHVA